MVLVSGSTDTMRAIGPAPNLGVFFNPNSSNYRRQVVPAGMPWAADNAAFSGFDAVRFLRMLDTLAARRLPGCLFVTVPDVVGRSADTCALFRIWALRLHVYGFPLAFVGQDGLQFHDVPWDDFSVFFVGGSTRWKLGIQAHTLCAYAKALGKRVHVGRVNSAPRAALFTDVADSIDGTATSRYGRIYIPRMLAAARQAVWTRTPQRELF